MVCAFSVDPQTYKVYIKTEDKSSEEDWELVMCPPSSRLPLGQRYFLF
jgi:urease alpha subunit